MYSIPVDGECIDPLKKMDIYSKGLDSISASLGYPLTRAGYLHTTDFLHLDGERCVLVEMTDGINSPSRFTIAALCFSISNGCKVLYHTTSYHTYYKYLLHTHTYVELVSGTI